MLQSGRLPLPVLFCLGLLPGVLFPASSTSYRLDFDIADGGGGSTASANYRLQLSSVHPQSLGESSSVAYRVHSGLVSLPDTDGDGIRNTLDNCPGLSNPTQTDNDADGLGNVCDPYPDNVDGDGDGLVDGAGGVVPVGVYNGIDADGDGFVDGELDAGTLASNPDTDNDGFNDGQEVYFSSDPLSSLDTPATGDVSGDGVVDAHDLLLVTRHVLGVITLDADQQVRADVAPVNGLGVPTPDNAITAGDLLRIQQMAVRP